MTNNANDIILSKIIGESYDEIPYESFAFSYTRPEYLRTLGMLFGMTPPDIETARILELGSASGGNLINFAANYPKSYTLGVDLSKIEIEHGITRIKDLGLKNIELKHLSITDIDEYFGQFDYIICHGVFSWVPQSVREKILNISKKLLSKHGIAYVSYNALPGWNMMNTIRDMMLFHSSIFNDNNNKLEQAKLFLNFVNESLEGSNTPYAKFLKQETEALSKYDDFYLRHEYLAEENIQFYFHDFINMAQIQGLQYLAEAHFYTMFLGNLSAKAIEKLQVINDIVRIEQYMDFIQNKRFRCTLLCHNDLQLHRNITPERLENFYMTSNIFPDQLEKDVDLGNALESVNYYLNNVKDAPVATSSPIMKSILYVYCDNIGNPLKPDQVIKLAHRKLNQFTIEEFRAEFYNSMPRLIFAGFVKLFSTLPKAVCKISQKPKVTDLCRYQVKCCAPSKFWVTSQINEVSVLQLHEKYILEELDGHHTIEQLEEKIIAKFRSGELVAHANNNIVTSEAALKEIAQQSVASCLERFRINYILIG